MSKNFNWLHLTDLHFGQKDMKRFWPEARKAFFDDLRVLRKHCGPWHAVFFTGDLAYSGQAEQYQSMESEFLLPLWQLLQELDSGDAALLAVPGNHDIARPDQSNRVSAALRMLLKPERFHEISSDFWKPDDAEYRPTIEKSLEAYSIWWNKAPYRDKVELLEGSLPGDFLATIPLPDLVIGVVGLNSTFLQIQGGNYVGKLAIDMQQLLTAHPDLPKWTEAHDACILLTHQGVDWFLPESQITYDLINPAGRFITHLFGHMHENNMRGISAGGGPIRHQWQGNSLCGLEPYETPEGKLVERRHGYSSGSLHFGAKKITLRCWPRTAVIDSNGTRIIPDNSAVIMSDGGTQSTEVGTIKKKALTTRERAKIQEKIGRDSETRLLSKYTSAARKQWDILDLAGLPEGDRHLALAAHYLRDLYLPLRLKQEFIQNTDASHKETKDLESKRLIQRLSDAGERVAREHLATPNFSLGDLLYYNYPESKPESKDATKSRISKNFNAPRILVLGDPGGGKTTLLRWLATSYLLRFEDNPDLTQLPDAHTLPPANWLPILVRCRDLNKDITGNYTLRILLRNVLPHLQLTDKDIERLINVLEHKLELGEAILLIDGLDEIADIGRRIEFCERLDEMTRNYSQSPLVVTSRIVGYKEMQRRVGNNFLNTTIADLTAAQKDDFIDRWCDSTIRDKQRSEEEKRTLKRGIHETERIERLTTNPMLLTTMALVHRNVGKLPPKRHKLYAEAVDLLLRWRRSSDEPAMDADEVLPQLEYLAYIMCDRGVQQIRRDEALELLDEMRLAYPNLRAVHRHTTEEFLVNLERRTGLLMESGEIEHLGRQHTILEFRHLTFQEYMAALSIIRGHFKNYRPDLTIAEIVNPLAAKIEQRSPLGTNNKLIQEHPEVADTVVSEMWRECLRLCVAMCSDNNVEDVLRKIIESNINDAQTTKNARVVLAALCLADEPNISQDLASLILDEFLSVLGADSMYKIHLAKTAIAPLIDTTWRPMLYAKSVMKYINSNLISSEPFLDIWTRIIARDLPLESKQQRQWLRKHLKNLSSNDDAKALFSAVYILSAAQSYKLTPTNNLVNSLIEAFSRKGPSSDIATRALLEIYQNRTRFMLSTRDSNTLNKQLKISTLLSHEKSNVFFLSMALMSIDQYLIESDKNAFHFLLSTNNKTLRKKTLLCLLRPHLNNIDSLGIDLAHLSLNNDLVPDPKQTILVRHINIMSKNFNISKIGLQDALEVISGEYKLDLGWH